MKPSNTPATKTASLIRAIALLAAVFALTSVATFGSLRAMNRDNDLQPSRADLEQARAEAVAAIPRLPADTEDRLASALYPQLAPITSFSDPLVDRAGLDPTAPAATQPRLRAVSMTSAPALPAAPVVPERLARLTRWQQSVRSATATGLIPPPITTAYLMSEVSPVGRLDMRGRQGAWLYIQAENRTFAANVGAKFYDGVLVSVGEEGVVFHTSTGQTKVVGWDRQEEFSTSPAQNAGSGDQQPAQQAAPLPTPAPPGAGASARPAVEGRGEKALQAAPIASLVPESSRREDYSDLQAAVRNRYPSTVTPGGPDAAAPGTSSSARSATAQNAPAAEPVGDRALSAEPDTMILAPRRSRTSDTAPGTVESKGSPDTQASPAAPAPEATPSPTVPARKVSLVRPQATRDRSFSHAPMPAASESASEKTRIRPLLALYSSAAPETSAFYIRDATYRLPGEEDNEEAAVADSPAVSTGQPTPTPTPSPSPSPVTSRGAKTNGTVQDAGRPETKPDNRAGAGSAAATTTTRAPVPAPATYREAPGAASAPDQNQARRNSSPLCDPAYRGENITITNESNRPLSLLSFINRINEAYGANIVLDYDVQETPVRVTINDAPWTSVLRTLLDLNDLDMVCLDGGIVQVAKRAKILQMGEQRRKTAPIERDVFKLRYLQQTAGGRANLAGQTQPSNGATIQSLEDAIRDILKAGGDTRGDVRRVPGRNELLVAATHEQMEEIRDLIKRVDRPGYQVKISALVYTANENRLQDIGSQLSIVVGNASGTNLGGGTTLPNSTATGSTGTGTGTGSGQPISGLNPGGIPGLFKGAAQPTNGLGAANPLATFGVTSIFGTAQFAYQLTLAEQKGIVNIQSRPFGIVSDGDTFDLVAGTQIPVVTATIAGGAAFQSGQVQFIEASRIARITPQVAEDEHGLPNFVTLNVQLENNSVDTSLGTFNGVPGVNRQSLQTVLRLRNGETVVIGGLAADQVSNAMAKVPGLGDLPVLGNLFKKKTNQENRDRLYFAITVQVIAQDSAMPNFQAPSDAMTAPPPPPAAQRPSPYEDRRP